MYQKTAPKHEYFGAKTQVPVMVTYLIKQVLKMAMLHIAFFLVSCIEETRNV